MGPNSTACSITDMGLYIQEKYKWDTTPPHTLLTGASDFLIAVCRTFCKQTWSCTHRSWLFHAAPQKCSGWHEMPAFCLTPCWAVSKATQMLWGTSTLVASITHCWSVVVLLWKDTAVTSFLSCKNIDYFQLAGILFYSFLSFILAMDKIIKKASNKLLPNLLAP